METAPLNSAQWHEAIVGDLTVPQVVANVLGTEGDPQNYAAQRDRLAGAGCIVTATAARSSLAAAAVATGDQSLLGMPL